MAGEAAADRPREARRASVIGSVDGDIAPSRERGEHRRHLGEREVLADAASRSEAEREQRAMLFLRVGLVS